MSAKEYARGVRRALRILKALKGRTLDGISNGELAKALNDTPSNVTRALQVLIDEGLVEKMANGRFAHSIGLLQIAAAHADHIDRTEGRLREINQRVRAGAQQ